MFNTPRTILFAVTAMGVVLGACSNDSSEGGNDGNDASTVSDMSTRNDTSTGGDAGNNTENASTNNEIACVDDTGITEGIAAPASGLQFRNAFDPADAMIYDPAQDTLPAPVMVDVWGDRTTAGHGTVGVFPPGFSAPLHTHSEAYHGIVLSGLMSNPFGTQLEPFLNNPASHGDIELGPGAYWYVPAGAQHTTTCVGPDPCWFYFHAAAAFDFAPIVDDQGQLLDDVVLEEPPADSVQSPFGERVFAGEPGSFVEFAPAWGDMTQGAHGTFGRFTAGAVAPVHVHSGDYHAVVVEGMMTNPFGEDVSPPMLPPGSFWSVPARSVHTTTCSEAGECLFYFHADDAFDFDPVCE